MQLVQPNLSNTSQSKHWCGPWRQSLQRPSMILLLYHKHSGSTVHNPDHAGKTLASEHQGKGGSQHEHTAEPASTWRTNVFQKPSLRHLHQPAEPCSGLTGSRISTAVKIFQRWDSHRVLKPVLFLYRISTINTVAMNSWMCYAALCETGHLVTCQRSILASRAQSQEREREVLTPSISKHRTAFLPLFHTTNQE